MIAGVCVAIGYAQTSAPAPGSVRYGTPLGWNPVPSMTSAPAPGRPVNVPAFPSQGWGGNSLMWNSSPVSYQPAWQNPNYGTASVVGVGYDDEGVWRTVPLNIDYQYNGINYNVTVVNAWNPWTDSWDDDVDAPAYQTSYYLNGVTLNYYVPLSTGTYYFNL